jgi:hypothetical protein
MPEKEKEEPKPQFATVGRNSPNPGAQPEQRKVAPVAPMPGTEDHKAQLAADQSEDDEPEKKLDETEEGGRYQIGSKLVNADGEIIGDAPVPRKAAKK